MWHVAPIVGSIGRTSRIDARVEDEAIDVSAVDGRSQAIDLGGIRGMPAKVRRVAGVLR